MLLFPTSPPPPPPRLAMNPRDPFSVFATGVSVCTHADGSPMPPCCPPLRLFSLHFLFHFFFIILCNSSLLTPHPSPVTPHSSLFPCHLSPSSLTPPSSLFPCHLSPLTPPSSLFPCHLSLLTLPLSPLTPHPSLLTLPLPPCRAVTVPLVSGTVARASSS